MCSHARQVHTVSRCRIHHGSTVATQSSLWVGGMHMLGGASDHIKAIGSTPIHIKQKRSSERVGEHYPLSICHSNLAQISFPNFVSPQSKLQHSTVYGTLTRVEGEDSLQPKYQPFLQCGHKGARWQHKFTLYKHMHPTLWVESCALTYGAPRIHYRIISPRNEYQTKSTARKHIL